MSARSRSSGLTHRLGAGLILLGLWLQVIASAGALAVRAGTAQASPTDAVLHAVVCGRDVDPTPGAAASTDLPAPDCERCPLCRCTACPPTPVAPPIDVRGLRWRPVARPTPPPAPEPCASHRPGLARAPPRSV